MIRDEKRIITSKLLRWYRVHRRKLPWRGTRNAYRILLSEVMLQQTQVGRVVEKYPVFLRLFPTLSSLAQGSVGDVMKAWQGMGYNSRAVRLHRLARLVKKEYNGRLPRSVEQLVLLPGVGRYTAHAVASFAFDQPVPAVDTNAQRILQRLFPQFARRMGIWELAAEAMPRRSAYDWNQSLFDFGSLVCTATKPRCNVCPVQGLCPSAFKVKANPTRRPHNEPQWDGVPNRIYRGRIVEALRQRHDRNPLTKTELGKTIKRGYTKRDDRWLGQLLGALAREGMITLRQRGKRTYVSFAKS